MRTKVAPRFVLPCPQGALGTIPCLAAGFGSICSSRGAHAQGGGGVRAVMALSLCGGTEVTAVGTCCWEPSVKPHWGEEGW